MDRIRDYISYQTVEYWVPKVIAIAVIMLAASLAAAFLNKLINKWYERTQRRLRKKSPSSISSVNTKTVFIKKIVVVMVYFFALVMISLQFPSLRSLGTGLLASAGVLAVVAGMAAQNTLSDMIAGIAISFSQPVRLDDAVILDGDFGWVEEINLMQTFIRTWDNRRIIVPNSVLIHKVVQNWTIKDPSLLGAVMLYVDYTCDIDMLRKWVNEIVNRSEYSVREDRVSVVQVVDFTEKTMAVRILAKGPDAGSAWSLRCEIREKLIKMFKDAGLPLPRIRLDGNGLQGVSRSSHGNRDGQE